MRLQTSRSLHPQFRSVRCLVVGTCAFVVGVGKWKATNFTMIFGGNMLNICFGGFLPVDSHLEMTKKRPWACNHAVLPSLLMIHLKSHPMTRNWSFLKRRSPTSSHIQYHFWMVHDGLTCWVLGNCDQGATLQMVVVDFLHQSDLLCQQNWN